MAEYAHLIEEIDEELSRSEKKRHVLRELDMFVLDNSLRESSVGQLRGHTLENKWAILEEIKKCRFKHVIISGFTPLPRVDDTFVKLLSERESDMSNYFAFSELGEGPLMQEFPAGLKKMKTYGIQNPIIEIDLFPFASQLQTLRDLLLERIDYAYENLSIDAKIFVNIRDVAPMMVKSPPTVFDIVKFLGTMPAGKRPFGIMIEDRTGDYLPEQFGPWTRSLRRLMDECDWKSSHMLVHIHKRWELAEAVQLEILASGADGVWASVCKEGGILGHACSSNSIMNLIRMGNTKVLRQYNCRYLRQAAINITKITTGEPPQTTQTIYGERALDVVFDEEGKEEEFEQSEFKFDMNDFFSVKAPNRVSTLASPTIIKDRLIEVFGTNEQFTEDLAAKMKAVMIDELTNGRKEEYMSAKGLAVLFDRANGRVTPEMSAVIEQNKLESKYA